MNNTYDYPTYEYTPSEEEKTGQVIRHPVIVIGGGPAGLTAALDLAQQGVKVVMLDEDNTVSEGSRAICFAQRSLEVFDRLGAVQPMRDLGVQWNVGRLYFEDEEVYNFNLQPEPGYAHPAFINLQQYYVEQYLIETLLNEPNADTRWNNRVIDMTVAEDHVRLTVETPNGTYQTECDYLIAADGARSPTRKRLGLDYDGIIFEEKFLIADVVMHADFPSERRYFFDPSFHPGQSVLLHRQPDDVWRIDFQLGRDADIEEELKPENIKPRIQTMLGEDVEFDLEWVSIYRFHSRMLDAFVHGRVCFVGDSAHLVSPFGARGANSGIQDAENLAWKLAMVVKGKADASLLDSYDYERVLAARENLNYTESSTKFISPDNDAILALRNAVLELAKDYEFARPIINSGRLSTATLYPDSPLNTPDAEQFDAPLIPGAPCHDAPITIADDEAWFLKQLGAEFNGLLFTDSVDTLSTDAIAQVKALAVDDPAVQTIIVSREPYHPAEYQGMLVVHDVEGYLFKRYDAQPETFYLVRPDQYVCARWRQVNSDKIKAAVARVTQRAAVPAGV